MLWTAILLGFLVSFHCLLMCGPLALAFSYPDNSGALANRACYSLGWTVTYSLLGLLVGTVGVSFQIAGAQQWFSVIMGILIIVMAMHYKKSEGWLYGKGLSGLAKGVKGMLSRYLTMGGKTAFFAGGMINGL